MIAKLFSWLSCCEYTKRSSRYMDRELSLLEKPGYLFHHLVCLSCRRFSRQVLLINKVCECYEPSEGELPVGNQVLSEKRKEEILNDIQLL